jgi:hypothetical protein
MSKRRSRLRGYWKSCTRTGIPAAAISHFLSTTAERLSLHFAGDPPALATGVRVWVRGRVDDMVALGGSVRTLSSALPNTLGPHDLKGVTQTRART